MASLPRSTRLQNRGITLRVQRIEHGALRLSSPAVPGWSGIARTDHELLRLIASALACTPTEPAGRGYRSDTHDPTAWTVRPDGKWIAPGEGRSRVWSPTSWVVRRVQAQRVRLGLPASPAAMSIPDQDVP